MTEEPQQPEGEEDGDRINPVPDETPGGAPSAGAAA